MIIGGRGLLKPKMLQSLIFSLMEIFCFHFIYVYNHNDFDILNCHFRDTYILQVFPHVMHINTEMQMNENYGDIFDEYLKRI